MGDAVDAPREAADHRYARLRQIAGEVAGDLLAVCGRPPGAHHGHAELVLLEQGPFHVYDGWQVVDLAQAARVRRVVPRDHVDSGPPETLHLAVRVGLAADLGDRPNGGPAQSTGQQLSLARLPRCF